MELSDFYLISGVFFQQQTGLGLRCDPLEGMVTVLRSGIGEFLYAGILYRDPHHSLGGYAGTMRDDLGRANLRNGVITYDRLTFDKHYQNGRPHNLKIKYDFRLQDGNLWVGEYAISEEQMRGPTKCFLIPITAEFFQHNLTIQTPHPQKYLRSDP